MHLRRLMPIVLAVFAGGVLLAACGDDDDDSAAANQADQQYLVAVCSAFDTFQTAVFDKPDDLATAVTTLADDLSKAEAPKDYKKSHDKLVSAVRDAKGDLSRLASLGSEDVPDKKADQRLADKARDIPECKKAGVFQ